VRTLALVLMMAAMPAKAVEVTQFMGLQVLGGQYFFSGEKSPVSVNASGVISPAIKYDDNWTFLPSLNSSYQGTKQVLDVVGAGTLVQEQWDNRLSAKAVYQPSEDSAWRIKPNGSFKYQLLKETKNEEWSSGLFDYYKWDLGTEVEYVYHEPFSIRGSLDYFEGKFPNYGSLESQAALTVGGNALARELVGDHVLDTRNIMSMFAVDGPVAPGVIGEFYTSILYQSFYNQALVDDTGALIAKKRQDFMTTFGGALKVPFEVSRTKLIASLDASVDYNTSNQNSYDAQRTHYTELFYNYGDLRVGPTFKAYFGPGKRPVAFSFAAQYWYRRYPHRRTQDANGVYQGESLHQNNWMTNTTLKFPFVNNFDVIMNFQYGKASSNQRFENFYSYNYRVANYLFGFSYGF
jgi:hypothetical protein